MKRLLSIACGLFASLMLAISVGAHVYSFLPSPPLTGDVAFVLLVHFGVIAAFGSMCIAIHERKYRFNIPEPTSLLNRMQNQNRRDMLVIREIFEVTPRWAVVLFIVAACYVFINFMAFIGRDPVNVEIRNGHTYATGEDRVTREISREDYERLYVLEVRGFSGHWMFFALAPTIYFWFVLPRLRKLDATESEVAENV